MTDDLTRMTLGRRPTAAHPLTGLTVLAVEDSRFACEALRLLCMRSGARIRRADCLSSARRHLTTYRPQVALVDIGLPDGDGTELIAEMVRSGIPPLVILGMSGDADGEAEARRAGAHGFLAKPVGSIGAFQAAILAHLPDEMRPAGPRIADPDGVQPDTFALKDDLTHAAEVLEKGDDEAGMDYAAQFLASVARSSEDAPLAEAASRLASRHTAGISAAEARGHLSRIVRDRLAGTHPI